jgi:hypothetical protein
MLYNLIKKRVVRGVAIFAKACFGHSNQALLDIFACKNKAWREKNLTKIEAGMERTPTKELDRSKRRLTAVENAISCYVDMYTNLSSRKQAYYGSRADDLMATDELYALRKYDLPQAKMALKYTERVFKGKMTMPQELTTFWRGHAISPLVKS